MVSVAHYSALVASIYRAATEADQWTATLTQIAQATGAVSCALLRSDHRSGSATVESYGNDPDAMRAYDHYYGRLDPAPAALDRLPVGAVVTREQAVSRQTLLGTEFFTDWVRPGGYADSMFAVLAREGGATSWFAIGPGPGGDWSECARLLDALAPHLRQAIETQFRIAALERQNQDFSAAMDAAADGLVIVGPDGAIRHGNPAALRMLSGHDGLTLRHRELSAAIHRALHGRPATGDCLQVRRASSARPYIVRVVPLTTEDAGPPRGALLVIADPEAEPQPAPDALRRIYGLTRAEAEVALRVLNGTGLKPIAEELSMSLSTVRTHLQHVFDKTDTHRQAELVRLLLGGLSATRSPQSQPFG